MERKAVLASRMSPRALRRPVRPVERNSPPLLVVVVAGEQPASAEVEEVEAVGSEVEEVPAI